MDITPSLESFAASFAEGRPQVVWTRLVADTETPVSAMLKLAEGRPFSLLLESVEGGAVRGRYSIICLKPDLIWRCHGERAEINRRARFDTQSFEPEAQPSLASLRRLIDASRIPLPAELPPMAMGLFGYMAYDFVRLIERLPDANPDPLRTPDAIFVRPTVVAVFDNVEDMVTIVTPVWPEQGLSAERAYALARERLSDTVQDFSRGLIRDGMATSDAALPEPLPNMRREDFHAMVRRSKEYIAAGDIFQIVPSQRFTLPFRLPPFALYRALRRLNPSPFLFYLDLEDFALVGSSPEILVRLRDGQVTIRPLAGTRPRGATPEEDRQLEAELLTDEKELAEHLMLLDLGRNDVGRVAEVGTVEVTQKMNVEHYSHVMHIASNVQGRARAGVHPLDVLCAGFPAGTVSGAPKVRAMEIIDELEPVRRSFYAGAVGYFGADGNLDTCISLRTALLKDGTMYVQAGGGVVADSDPELEYQESRNKARALIRAAEEAVRYASRSR
ncbi:anthranilate synthase component I [Marinivivus vitaminiproducens]|uniref:anthranilate synthase component I n=1 Tax=Marinivivus vitaminiproducens TaxID=3035935 RepID=UPI0027A9C985|nr:anthranilate synthase component I [Geminicoccaceae bacterium SCSIO 64248]